MTTPPPPEQPSDPHSTGGRQAQRNAARLAMAVFVVLTLVGLNSLLAFAGKGVYPDWLTKPHGTEHGAVVYEGGQH